jgi:hypothetical protein
MENLFNWIFAAAQFATLVRLLWIGFPYRMFLIALCLSAIQAVNVNLYRLHDLKNFVLYWWIPVEVLAIIAMIAAVGEAIAVETKTMEILNRFLLRFGAWVLPCAWCLGSLRTNPMPANPIAIFDDLREWAWVVMMLALSVTILYLTFESRKASVHIRILSGLIIAHVITAPHVIEVPHNWYWWRFVFRYCVIGCCAAWCVFTPCRNSAEGPQSPSANS